jgi:hypothetical protein
MLTIADILRTIAIVCIAVVSIAAIAWVTLVYMQMPVWSALALLVVFAAGLCVMVTR